MPSTVCCVADTETTTPPWSVGSPRPRSRARVSESSVHGMVSARSAHCRRLSATYGPYGSSSGAIVSPGGTMNCCGSMSSSLLAALPGGNSVLVEAVVGQ